MKARDYNPAVKYGAKWLPSDLAGIVGQPQVGNIFYVDANNGSDTANSGTSWDDAFITLTQAEDSAVTNNYDVIVIAPGGTSGTAEIATLTWDKNHITVVGGAAPNLVSSRSRVVWTVDSTDPGMTLSGQGNRFINVQLATFQASNDILINLTGQRNYFSDVHFAGVGNATAGDDATSRCIDINGGSENYFGHCLVGLDSIFKSTTNAEIELRSSATRNIFEDCRINTYADNSGHIWVKMASNADIDRYVEFKDTLFFNAVNSGATTMTTGMDVHSAVGGTVLLTGTTQLIGATDWSNDFTAVVVGGPVPTAATSNFLITAA